MLKDGQRIFLRAPYEVNYADKSQSDKFYKYRLKTSKGITSAVSKGKATEGTITTMDLKQD
jgi:hypothetical protein